MSNARTKLVSARLTDAEYAAVERAAGADTISAWARTALLHAATPPPVVPPVEWNAGGTLVEQDSNTRPPRRHDGDRHDVVLRPDDHAPAVRHGPASAGTSRTEWRANSTARWAWDPALATGRTWTRSAAWLPTIVVLACLSAGGIVASQYVHASTDESWLDMAQPALWGAVAVLMAGLAPMLSDDVALALDRRAGRSAKASRWQKWR
jgi:hypothetical protein